MLNLPWKILPMYPSNLHFQHIRTGKLKLHHNTTTALTHIHTEITHTHSPFHVALSSHQLASHIILLKLFSLELKKMYGLKESGFIANQELKVVLAKQGYIPSKFTPGLFTCKTRSIAFSLVVDDFGVKYEKKEDMDH
jgi:hypothetical protein